MIGRIDESGTEGRRGGNWKKIRRGSMRDQTLRLSSLRVSRVEIVDDGSTVDPRFFTFPFLSCRRSVLCLQLPLLDISTYKKHRGTFDCKFDKCRADTRNLHALQPYNFRCSESQSCFVEKIHLGKKRRVLSQAVVRVPQMLLLQTGFIIHRPRNHRRKIDRALGPRDSSE